MWCNMNIPIMTVLQDIQTDSCVKDMWELGKHTGDQKQNSFLWKNHHLEIAPNTVVYHQITAINKKITRSTGHQH